MRCSLILAIPALLLMAAGAGADLTADKKTEAEALIAQFGAKEFSARQAAVDKLIAMGADVRPLVEKALTRTADAEVKLRCEMVLKGLQPKPAAPAAPPVLREKFLQIIGPVAYGKADQSWYRNDDGSSQIYRHPVPGAGKFRVTHGTWESGEYDEVLFTMISAEGDGSSYWAKRDGKKFMVINHVEQPVWDRCGFAVLSRDGKRFLYCGFKGKDVYVVADGKDFGPYSSAQTMGFTPDDRHAAWIASRPDGGQAVVLDGREGPRHEHICALHEAVAPGEVSWPLLGRYFVTDKGRVRLVEYEWPKTSALGGATPADGAGGDAPVERELRVAAVLPKNADAEGTHYVSHDGKHYLSFGEIGRTVYVDGKKIGAWDSVWQVLTSGDGEHYAFLAKRGDKSLGVFDGKEGPAFEEVDRLWLPPASGHFSYIGRRDNRWFAVMDGRVDARGYESIGWRCFANSGRHIAYVGHDQGEDIVIQDGVEIARHEKVESMSYDPTGDKLLYVAMRSKRCFVVIGGRKGPEFGEIPLTPHFSPDGRHVWYGVLEGGVSFVVCDGIRGRAHDALDDVRRNAERKDVFRHIILDKGNDCLVEVAWPEGVDWTNGLEPLE